MAEPPDTTQYRPPAYDAADPERIVRDYPFALLVSPDTHATPTPLIFEFDDDNRSLIGHLAGRNLHALAMRTGDRVLAVFSGPHAYVSPRWYVEKPSVPTWNYVSAHVRGRLEIIDDHDEQLFVLRRSIDLMEAGFPDPWRMEDAPEGYVEALLPLIRAFRIHIESLTGVTKLNQTHPPGDRARIIEGLSNYTEPTIADYMRRLQSSPDRQA